VDYREKERKLREERARLWEEMKGILEGSDDLSGDALSRFEERDQRVDELNREIDAVKRARELEDHFAQPQDEPTPRTVDPENADPKARDEQYRQAFWSYLVRGMPGMSGEDQRTLLVGRQDLPDEVRALGIATGGAGGFLVPEGFRNQLIEVQKWFSNLRDVATVIATNTGAPLPWPTNDDTANKGAILAENVADTELDMTFGQAQVGAHMYTSKIVRVSLQFLQDTTLADGEGIVARKLGERLGRIQNEHFTTGTGTNQPEGIQTNAVVGKQGAAGQTTTVTYDDLVDVEYSVNRAYRRNARWMMSDNGIKVVRKLKDGDGRPLWEPSVQVGEVTTLLGYPVEANSDLPNPAANVKSILFGDFREAYVIRDVLGVQLMRLSERYAEFLQVAFLAFQRTDAKLQNAAAVRAYQQAAA